MTALLLNDIIVKNTDAIGGTAAVEAIHNLQMKLHIVENRVNVKAVYWRTTSRECELTSTQATSESTLKAMTASKLGGFRKEKQAENPKAETPQPL
jgi:hypothetical protein